MDLVYRLLDDQIVDVDGVRCGRVDDIELTGSPPSVSALLVGRGVYAGRLPRRLRGLGRRVFGDDVRGRTVTRVPWEQVDRVDTAVHLRGKAEDLGL